MMLTQVLDVAALLSFIVVFVVTVVLNMILVLIVGRVVVVDVVAVDDISITIILYPTY